jgi:hypothetical protein
MAGKLALLFALLTSGISSPAGAAPIEYGQERPIDTLIHSDLPLFGYETGERWPQAMRDGESIGCISRVAFGDWILRTKPDETPEDAEWYRVRNYGVFHCWALVGAGWEGREGLDRAELKPSFFVEMDNVDGVEIWALQIGARPGSDYLLLSRKPGKGIISSFSVLQRQCPEGKVRQSAPIDILRTEYCAINSAAELRSLAREMLKREPLGTLSFFGKETESDAQDK